MSELHSRLLFAFEVVLIGLPGTFFFVVPFAIPAALLLTPITLFGLAGSLIKGGPQIGHELWAGAEVLVMALVGLSTVAALLCFLGLSTIFLFLGRAGLSKQTGLLRWGLLCGSPPILLSSIPRVVEEIGLRPFDLDRLLPSLLYSGLPLLIPAVHVALEVRFCQRSSTARDLLH